MERSERVCDRRIQKKNYFIIIAKIAEIVLHNWFDPNVPLTSTGKNQFEFTHDGGTFKITIISDILLMVNETGKFTEDHTDYDYDVTYFLMKGDGGE